jgi:molybdate transport system regulatory protein
MVPSKRGSVPRQSTSSRAQGVRLRIRVYRGEDIALGPGKATLLEAIQRTGSISQAATDLDMSYMRAWTLIRTMNTSFRDPLVETERGGAAGGHARLTPTGREVLLLYRSMAAAGLRATRPAWRKLQRYLQ